MLFSKEIGYFVKACCQLFPENGSAIFRKFLHIWWSFEALRTLKTVSKLPNVGRNVFPYKRRSFCWHLVKICCFSVKKLVILWRHVVNFPENGSAIFRKFPDILWSLEGLKMLKTVSKLPYVCRNVFLYKRRGFCRHLVKICCFLVKKIDLYNKLLPGILHLRAKV